MKKLILIINTSFFHRHVEMNAQKPSWHAFISDIEYTDAADQKYTSIFGTKEMVYVILTISEKTPSQAAALWPGPDHNGMGATGWGSFTAGAYNRASGNGAFVGFHNVAGPTR